MAYIKIGEEIIIYGAGKEGKLLYYKIKNKYKVKFFIDNDESLTNLYGISVYSIDKLKDYKEDAKIIIACSKYEKEMMESLYSCGYKFFDDFISISLLDTNEIDLLELYEKLSYNIEKFKKASEILCDGREQVLIHGNCQTRHLFFYLCTNKDFIKKYIFIKTPRIYMSNCIEIYHKLEKYKLLDNVTLLITQQIRVENKFHKDLATDKIISLLPDKCKTVKIANLYFAGYFPQLKKINEHAIMTELTVAGNGFFPAGDKNIDDLMEKGYSIEKIIEKLNDEDFYGSEYLEENVEKELKELVKREENLDVKMEDFIRENYKKELLFYAVTHPGIKVLKELAQRILKYLNFSDTTVHFCETVVLKSQDTLLYPAVIKAFGLDERYKEVLYYPNKYVEPGLLLSFNEYIRAYIEMSF